LAVFPLPISFLSLCFCLWRSPSIHQSGPFPPPLHETVTGPMKLNCPSPPSQLIFRRKKHVFSPAELGTLLGCACPLVGTTLPFSLLFSFLDRETPPPYQLSASRCPTTPFPGFGSSHHRLSFPPSAHCQVSGAVLYAAMAAGRANESYTGPLTAKRPHFKPTVLGSPPHFTVSIGKKCYSCSLSSFRHRSLFPVVILRLSIELQFIPISN